MIRHIVLWTFREHAGGADRAENIRAAAALLRELPARISCIRSFEVGVDVLHGEQSFDLALSATFASLDDLREYQQHPEHQRVVAFLRSVHNGRAVVDFESER
jgi:hypothetical protein